MRVVLPAPLGPSRPMARPFSSAFRSWRIQRLPSLTPKRSREITGACMRGTLRGAEDRCFGGREDGVWRKMGMVRGRAARPAPRQIVEIPRHYVPRDEPAARTVVRALGSTVDRARV